MCDSLERRAASSGYASIVEKIFQRTKFHRFLLEYDAPRSGTFEPRQMVPEDRIVVLGLVATKQPELET